MALPSFWRAMKPIASKSLVEYTVPELIMARTTVRYAAVVAGLWVVAVPLLAESKDYVLATEFEAPLTISEALTRLDGFYQKEIKMRGRDTLLRVSDTTYYEVWRDIWFVFEQKKPALLFTRIETRGSGYDDISKKFILESVIAVGGPPTVTFQNSGSLAVEHVTISATENEIISYLRNHPSGYEVSAYPNWRTYRLYLCAMPRIRAWLDPDALKATVNVTVESASADAVRTIIEGARQVPSRQRIAVLTSARADVDRAIKDETERQVHEAVDALAKRGTHPKIDMALVEKSIRESPEFQKRLKEAADVFLVKFRTDQDYQKVNLRWFELEGFSTETKQYSQQKLIKDAEIADVRRNPDPAHLFVIPVELGTLTRGGYKILLVGHGPGGSQNSIDQRTYYYNGSTFLEQ
jgi:hypothetical protein